MPTAVLAGVGSWLPPHRVTNEELGDLLGKPADWIYTRTGIRSRHIAEPGTTTGDLAVAAGRAALRSAGADHVSAVVLATTSPDRICPGTAPHVAARLDLAGAAAFDVQAACAGFIHGLGIAQGLIAAGTVESALVIGADRMSAYLDPEDVGTRPVFGDGAGAVVLRAGTPGEPGRLGPCVLGSDGHGRDLITVRGGATEDRSRARVPGAGPAARTAADAQADPHLRMMGAEVFRHAVVRMEAASRQALDAAGWKAEEVDRVVPHQANARIIALLVERLGIAPDRVLSNIEHVGNTSAASIPVLLDQAQGAGDLKAGHRVLLPAFGAGLAWAAVTLEWPHLAALA
ncbi:beta-ketoacyl-ACP synthase III [Streptomyces sp. URMC 123]|uniref:beta-ketoacyl-ACP synthase III n=1 Tax=Streptomyces sp. URMC 123 TaxID=3423403 RepID=UPI003F192CBE